MPRERVHDFRASADRSQRIGESTCLTHVDSEGEPHLPEQVVLLAQQPDLPETAPGAAAGAAVDMEHDEAPLVQVAAAPETAPGADVMVAVHSADLVAQHADEPETAPGAAVLAVELHAPRKATSERQARVVRVFIEVTPLKKISPRFGSTWSRIVTSEWIRTDYRHDCRESCKDTERTVFGSSIFRNFLRIEYEYPSSKWSKRRMNPCRVPLSFLSEGILNSHPWRRACLTDSLRAFRKMPLVANCGFDHSVKRLVRSPKHRAST